MSYEVRTIPGCPNSGPAVELFKNVLHAEGLDPELLTVREISSGSEAAAVLFRGSPSFLAGGKDLFPSTADAGLSCRLYPADTGLSGLPSAESLRAAVRGTAASST
ncbi:hypothetical protein J2S98_003943 [Arthrobacter oryzae]|uniref:hypothetical protein n=1 Tax=Arthrobacter oryzae TaxID=409290 RepID=UPI00278056C8|nr:hypothetical protein [Arthrobacter oryzae]MDP9988754.1 hypothetical protein [Arthrobacter oryzae]